MAEYELVHEIQNLCPNNQMRDIFFEEVECDDPVSYVRSRLKGRTVELTWDAVPADQQTPAKQETQGGQQYADPYGGYYSNPFDMFRYFFG